MGEILMAIQRHTLSNYDDAGLQAMLSICSSHDVAGHHYARGASEAVHREIQRREAKAAADAEARHHAERLASTQRAMIFIDGTNLFFRLAAEKLIVPRILDLFTRFVVVAQMREIVRVYLYSVREQVEAALERHGAASLEGIRIVHGDGIKKADGNIAEKGVDALLVADLVYHAASRNCDVAIVVSTDTDFTFAIKRVEDFGCRTAVGGICSEVPDRLKQSSDRAFTITANDIIGAQLGSRAS